MGYALPYVTVLVCFAVMALIYAQRNEFEEDRKMCNNILIASIGLFYIFFAFRGYLCTDWRGYSEFYSDVSWSSILEITSSKYEAVFHEPGFTLLMCICKIISNEYAFFVIAYTTLETVLFLRFLKRWNIGNMPFVFMLFMMIVIGPGINASIKTLATGVTSVTRGSIMSKFATWTIRGLSDGRPLASYIFLTASGSRALAPRP